MKRKNTDCSKLLSLGFPVGCRKLHIEENYSPLKVVHRAENPVQKVEQDFCFSSEKTGAGEYCYGFNGMEKDDELKGSGNSYDFGARIYDSRLGRWLAVDPLDHTYPSHSPYNFAWNTPIFMLDPDGKKVIIHYTNKRGKHRTFKLKNVEQLKEDHKNAFVNEALGAFRIAVEYGLEEASEIITRKESVGLYYGENIKGGAVFIPTYEENYIIWDPAHSGLLISKEDAQRMHTAVLEFEEEHGKIPRLDIDPEGYAEYVKKKNEFLDPIRQDIIANTDNVIEPDEFLIHEFGHWLDLLLDGEEKYYKENASYDDNSEDALMDNKNEKDVIEGIEAKYARKKGKKGRKHHRGVAGGRRVDKEKRSSLRNQKQYKS